MSQCGPNISAQRLGKMEATIVLGDLRRHLIEHDIDVFGADFDGSFLEVPGVRGCFHWELSASGGFVVELCP